jgi:hypothetical protein
MVYSRGPLGPISFPEVERQYNEVLAEFKLGGIESVRDKLETLKYNLSLCLSDPGHGRKAQEYYDRVQKLLDS